MLRLIGALVIAILIIGPLLEQAGLLEHAGIFRDLIALEVQAFAQLVAWVRGLVTRNP